MPHIADNAIHLELKGRIMRRVYAVWFWRSVAPFLAVEAVLLLGVAAGVFSQISPRQILFNALSASSGVFDFAQFFIDNFFVKSIQSRLLAVLYVVVAGLFARDLWRVRRKFVLGGSEALAFLPFGEARR